MEVAGVVLGVIPLLISALEHYEDILKIVDKYRKYSSKIRVQHDELSTECTIFRAECVLLLAGSITRAQAETMLRDVSHPSWRDDTLVRRIERSFGSLGETLKTVTGAIVARLAETTSKLRKAYDCSDVLMLAADATSPSWRSSIKKKIKFALASNNSIQEDLDQIGKLNEKFVLLCSQTRQLEMAWTLPAYDSSTSNDLSKRRFDQCAVVRDIFIDLYDVFYRACPPDHRHVLRLGLDIKCNTQNVGPICCGLRHYTIDSGGGGPAASCTTNKSPDHSFEFQLEIASQMHPSHTTNRLLHSDVYTTTSNSNSIDASHATAASHDHIVDVSSTGQAMNLCARMSQSEQSSKQPYSTQPILLKGSKDFQHFVDVRGSGTTSYTTTSLAQLFSQLKNQGRRYEMPQHQRLGMAEYLGLRLLELHETPWLAMRMTSADLYFLGELGDVADITHFGYTVLDLDSLYVDVELTQILGPAASFDQTPAIDSSTLQGRPSRFGLTAGPKNAWLYSFGIVLLELAYQMSFSDLKAELEDEFAVLGWPLASDPQTAEYQIACQLADHVGRILGASYARIVRQCLRCTFDVSSSSLSNTELSWAVYRDVVCQLQKLRGDL